MEGGTQGRARPGREMGRSLSFLFSSLCSWLHYYLFAELIVDGVLSASLYRKLRELETRHWLETAIRRTAWPFAGTAAIVCDIGWAMAIYAPEAHSVGDVIAHAKQHR